MTKDDKEKSKYRVTREGNVYQPQVRWLFWWRNLNRAYTSFGEATKAINIHNAIREGRRKRNDNI